VVRQLLYLGSETIVTPANLACLPLLKPLIKTAVERRTDVSSTPSRWFGSAENDVEEMPLRLLSPQQRIRIRETIDGVINYDECLKSPHLSV
jgi:hypothetical protein